MAGLGATILAPAGVRLGRNEARFFSRAQPFGFILFARNAATPGQLAALCDALREAVGRAAPIFIDQEGGRVARLTPPHWRAWPPAREDVARAGAQAVRAMWLRYRIIAEELRACGIDGNCAPLADVATPQTHAILANRTYGTDPEAVARIGRAVAEGLLAGGVLPVLKHIPGHGRPAADSHAELPRTDAPLAALEAVDFAPFRALADLPLGMTAHVVYAALDPDRPATLSPVVLAHVRQRIGFGGLLMSDDISMGALSGPLDARAAAARQAGCDIVLHCNGELAEMEAVVEGAGTLHGAEIARAEAALAARRPPEPIDIAAAIAEYAAITGGG